MANAEEPLSPAAQLAAWMAEKANVENQLKETPENNWVKRKELINELNILSSKIARHCGYYELARPT